MPPFCPSIQANHREWIFAQPLFFTATAPLAGKHINVSPKGTYQITHKSTSIRVLRPIGHPRRTFAVLNDNQVAYLDSNGSGCETISHLCENGRITIMFCSFQKSPRIMRLFGTGRVIERVDPSFPDWVKKMRASGMEPDTDPIEGGKKAAWAENDSEEGNIVESTRAVIVIDVWKVQTSCGYGVPRIRSANRSSGDVMEKEITIDPESALPMMFDEDWDDRATLGNWSKKTIRANKITDYRKQWNSFSLDGIPGMKMARRDKGHWILLDRMRANVRLMLIGQWQAVLLGALMAFAMMFVLRFT